MSPFLVMGQQNGQVDVPRSATSRMNQSELRAASGASVRARIAAYVLAPLSSEATTYPRIGGNVGGNWKLSMIDHRRSRDQGPDD